MAPEMESQENHITVEIRLTTAGFAVSVTRADDGVESFNTQTVESAVDACAIAFSALHLDGEHIIAPLPVMSGGGIPAGTLFGVIDAA